MKLVAAYGSYKGTGTLILDTEEEVLINVMNRRLTAIPVPTGTEIVGFAAAKGALKMEIQLLVSLSDGSVMRGYGMFKKPWKQTRPWRRYLA